MFKKIINFIFLNKPRAFIKIDLLFSISGQGLIPVELILQTYFMLPKLQLSAFLTLDCC